MLNIQVLSNGAVTGDVGRIMAYEDQTYSEAIKVIHPSYRGALYKINYTWGHTQFSDMLDSDDQVKLHVHGAGILNCQFIAENALTGQVLLASKPFMLIVHEGINAGPNGATNCYRKYSCCDNGYNTGDNIASGNSIDAIVKLNIELAEEQRVRANNDSQLWDEILLIKNKLAEICGTSDESNPIVGDCNTLVTAGEFKLDVGSKHTPDNYDEVSLIPYLLVVKKYDTQVIQTAYASEEDTTKVYYRTGTIVNDVAEWAEWIPMVHETQVIEM